MKAYYEALSINGNVVGYRQTNGMGHGRISGAEGYSANKLYEEFGWETLFDGEEGKKWKLVKRAGRVYSRREI